MSLCVFALIASEFLPASLLTPMASDLHVSEGLTGQGIAISGAFAVLTSLGMPVLSGRVNRKAVLLALTALMALSGLVVGLAPNYLVYMAGRVLIGIVVGGFWSMSAASAMRLVPPHQVARALAIFNGGNALATVVAPPLGIYLASFIGWRGVFLCLVPLAAAAFIWQWIALPSMPAAPGRKSIGCVFKLLKIRLVAAGMLAVGAFFMGQFAMFTYLRPFLETVTRVDRNTLSLILLAMGMSGVIGTSFIGRFLKLGFYCTLIVIPLLMAAIGLGLTVLGSEVGTVAAMLAVWGAVGTAAPVGWWAWLAKTLPHDAEAGGGLMVAVVQLAIGLGSTVGGLLFDASGYRGTFVTSALLLLLAAILVQVTARSGHMPVAAPGP